MIKILLVITIALTFSGCIVGTLVSVPFKAVGAITPGIIGSVLDAAIPF